MLFLESNLSLPSFNFAAVIESPDQSILREKELILSYRSRGRQSLMAAGRESKLARAETGWWFYSHTELAESEQEVGTSTNHQRPPPGRLYPLKIPQHSQEALPAGDQMFDHVRPWGHFSFPPQQTWMCTERQMHWWRLKCHPDTTKGENERIQIPPKGKTKKSRYCQREKPKIPDTAKGESLRTQIPPKGKAKEPMSQPWPSTWKRRSWRH